MPAALLLLTLSLALCAEMSNLRGARAFDVVNSRGRLEGPGDRSADQVAENGIRPVHDPCLIRDGAVYYLFCTGPGIPIRCSRDLIRWTPAGRVFEDGMPSWARNEVPGSVIPWAPDIIFMHGRYFLYYSVSTFGRNRSIIALVSNSTLDRSRTDYRWKDEGKVIESFPGDPYNAIDSNVLPISSRRLALVFGSFWSGIQYVEADPWTGKPRPGSRPRVIAHRPDSSAIEAPFLFRHGGFYYLFASFDLCCLGVRSTYNIRVGRSRSVDGPFVDRQGRRMLDGGGTMVLESEGRVVGPGHCSLLHDGHRDILVHHFYDGELNGVPTLQVRMVRWSRDGWPRTVPITETDSTELRPASPLL